MSGKLLVRDKISLAGWKRGCFHVASTPQNLFCLLLGIFLMISNALHPLDRFVVITPEKTGTHLLLKILYSLTGKPSIHIWDRAAEYDDILKLLSLTEEKNSFFHMHAYYSENLLRLFTDNGYKIIFLIRDPRDQLISLLFFIQDQKWEYNQFIKPDSTFSALSIEERIEEMITGEKFGTPIPLFFSKKRIGWMHNEKDVLTVRYEHLVGPKGGGSLAEQIASIQSICKFINAEASVDIVAIAQSCFGQNGEWTFRKGQIGDWKNYFTDRHKMLFKELWNDLLIDLGYE